VSLNSKAHRRYHAITVYHNVNETQTHVKDYGLSIFIQS